jgi:hypothetical protein
MNARERNTVEGLRDAVNEMDRSNLKLVHKIERVIAILEDDPMSSRTGLITQVKSLTQDVEKLMYMNRTLKRASMFFLSILSALATMALKFFFFSDE